MAFWLLAAPATAQTQWTGNSSNSWGDAANWDAGVPNGGVSAVIDSSATNVVINAAAAAQDLYLGISQAVALSLEGGGFLDTSGSVYIGQGAAAHGAVTVSGAGTDLTVGQDLYVGTLGTGSLTVVGGGSVFTASASIVGAFGGSTGVVAIEGVGSSWETFDLLVIGDMGTGALSITDGGYVASSSLHVIVGNAVGSSGTVALSGSGSTFATGVYFQVGAEGSGELAISGGAVALSQYAYIGFGQSSVGEVSVSGVGSALNVALGFEVGVDGLATLEVTDGGLVSVTEVAAIGVAATSQGLVSVHGVDSMLEVGSDLYVGVEGTGALMIGEGARVLSGFNLMLGAVPGSTGAVAVADAGSLLSTAWDVYVGYEGEGSLIVADGGGAVNGVSLIAGALGGSSGSLVVTGDGSVLDVGADLDIGDGGSGTLVVSDGALVSTGSGVQVAVQAGSEGVVSIGGLAGSSAVGAGTLDTPMLAFGAGTGRLVFNHTDLGYAFDVPISGFGTIEHLAGVTNLTGDSSLFSGSTAVTGGVLRVNGLLGGNTEVSSGGTLSGTGLAHLVSILDGGTVAPGNSIGTLSVTDITFDAGSIYEVEVNGAGQSDLILASVGATINGGTVSVLAEAGTDASGSSYGESTTYTIVTATGGGVTGAFDGVSETFAYLSASLDYDADNVFLILNRDLTAAPDFCLDGFTQNQCTTATSVETLGPGNTLYDVVLGLDESSAQAGFDALSGEVYGSVQTMFAEDSRFVRDAALGRTAWLGDGDGSGRGLWGQGFAARGTWAGDGNAAGLDRGIGGVFVGGDGLVGPDGYMGVMAGYSRSEFSVAERDSEGSIESLHTSIYGGGHIGDGFSLRGGIGQSFHEVSAQRSVEVGGFSDSVSSGYGAGTSQVFSELGYAIEAGAAQIEPFAGLAHARMATEGFSETGGAAALDVAGQVVHATFTTLGVRAQSQIMLGEALKAHVHGMLGWRHTFANAPATFNSFAAGGDGFTVVGTDLTRDSLLLETALDLELAPQANLILTYQGQFAKQANDNTIKANLNVSF